jgi:hypothetical protein
MLGVVWACADSAAFLVAACTLVNDDVIVPRSDAFESRTSSAMHS